MKLLVQTLTGEKTEVEVQEGSTVRDLKIAAYKSGKILQPFRVLKGRGVLEDGSTLAELNIKDGDTVNIVIEPDREIEVEVKCGPLTHKHKVSHSMTIRELKRYLIDNNEVALSFDNLNLVKQETNGEVMGELSLEDLAPLHFYIQGNTLTLHVLDPFTKVKIQNSFGSSKEYKIPRNFTVKELRKLIQKGGLNDHGFVDLETVTENFRLKDIQDIVRSCVDQQPIIQPSLFVSCGDEVYKQLGEGDNDIPLLELLGEDKMVYVIDNEEPFEEVRSIRVCRHGEDIIDVNRIISLDAYQPTSETVLAVKLRVQQETGIPVKRLSVYAKGISVYDKGSEVTNEDPTGIPTNREVYIDVR